MHPYVDLENNVNSMHAQGFQFPSELHGIHTFLEAMEGRQSWKNTYYTEKWVLTCCLPVACQEQDTTEFATLPFLFLQTSAGKLHSGLEAPCAVCMLMCCHM